MKNKSRYIPVPIKNIIEKRDKFKCVWCGTKIMEKHHLVEFHLGGKNTVENLVTLCSNCHTIIHKGGIDPIELMIRRDIEREKIRIGGNTCFSVSPPISVKIGSLLISGNKFDVIKYSGKVILSYSIDANNELSISCRFYSKEGGLIFWMYNNFYCTDSSFYISNRADELIISDETKTHYVEMKKIADNSFSIRYNTFLGGAPFSAEGTANDQGIPLVIAGNRFTFRDPIAADTLDCLFLIEPS